MTATEFLEAFAGAAGTTLPSPEKIEDLLELAPIAAHPSERPAAPIAAHPSERPAAPIACCAGATSSLPASELFAAVKRVAPGVG